MPNECITEARVSQVLEGYRLGDPGEVQCMNRGCQRKLRDGHPVTVYASQSSGDSEWVVTDVYCANNCEPKPSRHPAAAQTEVTAHAWLGVISLAATQVSLICLTNVEVVAAEKRD